MEVSDEIVDSSVTGMSVILVFVVVDNTELESFVGNVVSTFVCSTSVDITSGNMLVKTLEPNSSVSTPTVGSKTGGIVLLAAENVVISGKSSLVVIGLVVVNIDGVNIFPVVPVPIVL